jgi:hypothetical protein
MTKISKSGGEHKSPSSSNRKYELFLNNQRPARRPVSKHYSTMAAGLMHGPARRSICLRRECSTGQKTEARARTFRFKDMVDNKHPIDKVLERLQDVHPSGVDESSYYALCPAHADSSPSLSVTEADDGQILLHCHSGCTCQQIVKEMGLKMQDLFPNRSTVSSSVARQQPPPVKLARPALKPQRKDVPVVKPAPEHPAVRTETGLTTAPDSKEDWALLARQYERECDDDLRNQLASELAVSADALEQLRLGWNDDEQCYTFPELNATGQVVGISRRYVDGKKKAMPGSKRGLSLARDGWKTTGPLLIVEGPTDVAAALTLGFDVVGRPSVTVGKDDLLELLADFPADREILIVGEMDPKTDGSWPGRDGAEKLADSLASGLGRTVAWCLPPGKAKDLRVWLGKNEAETDRNQLRDQFLAGVKKNEVHGSQQQLQLIDSTTFATTEYQQAWLVRGVLVAGQPAIVGGPKKTLKTSLLIDLAVSLGTGGKFLGEFSVERKRVGMISGESGQRTLQETYLRIRRARLRFHHTDVSEDDIRWGFELPRLGDPDGLAALDAMIREHALEVVILDPLYLSLLAGRPDVQASNLFHMGPLLADAARVCLEAGATPLFVHHNVKQKDFNFEPPELEDLAFAGIQEFARQWLLVGRRERYEPGTGEHRLWLNVGGSAGFSGCWAVDVDEGVVDVDFCGRKWDVKIRSAFEQRKTDAKEKKSATEKKTLQQLEQDKEVIERLLGQYPLGETARMIDMHSGMSRKRASNAIRSLLEEGIVQAADVTKGAGTAGARSYPGFRLADPISDEENAKGELEDDVD